MSDFIWEVEKKAEEYAEAKREAAWTIRPSVSVYYNPEFRCPYCSLGFPTKRLWMVDEASLRILGCWYLEDPIRGKDGKLTLRTVGNYYEEVVHPHADAAGGLCMGNANSAFQLLFHGIAPGEHHRHTDKFLLNVGHDCSEMPRGTCKICSSDFPMINVHYYGIQPMCSEDCVGLARSRSCYGCYSLFGENREARHGDYCPACFAVHSKLCIHCKERYLLSDLLSARLGRYICHTCAETASGPCPSCQVVTPYSAMIHNPNRGRCLQCQWHNCVRCSVVRLRSRLSERMYCDECEIAAPHRFVEQTAYTEFGPIAVNATADPASLSWSAENLYRILRENEVQPCEVSIGSSLPVSEESVTGFSGVSVEILQEPES